MPQQKESCLRRICGCGFTLAILGGGAYGMWWWLGKPDVEESIRAIDLGDITNVLGNLTDLRDVWKQDPFAGNTSVSPWGQEDPGVGGLFMELQNALDDTWTSEFVEAVQNWENGSPDSLTLSTTKVSIDRVCTHVRALMKVCNGNYGDTGWLGINEMFLDGRGVIQSSVAKMNEYYLLNADYDERQYTMCHEIGHGFGLPHTDENFNNQDLGNCLDYTNRPRNNQLPGQVNFDKLVESYGSVDGTIVGTGGITKEPDNRRTLRADAHRNVDARRRYPELDETVYSNYTQAVILQARNELLDELAQASRRQLSTSLVTNVETIQRNSGWSVESYHDAGGHFSRHLEGGSELRISALFPIIN